MKKYIISPTHDVDSLVSHVIAQIWEPEIEHRTLEYKSEDIPFKNIPENNNQHIIIADLGYSDSESNRNMVSKLERLKESGTTITFYDQHFWPIEIQNKAFNRYLCHKDISSAELMTRDLLPYNEPALFLAALATKDDYNNPDEDTNTLTDLVNSEFSKKRLITQLAKLKEPKLKLTRHAKKALNNYRKDKSTAIENLRKTYEQHNTSIGNIVTGLAPKILYMKPGHRKIRDDNPTCNVICFYESYQNCTFRTKNPEQMDTLLSIFKGGGRGTEGGFDPGELVTKNNYHEVKNHVLEKLIFE